MSVVSIPCLGATPSLTDPIGLGATFASYSERDIETIVKVVMEAVNGDASSTNMSVGLIMMGVLALLRSEKEATATNSNASRVIDKETKQKTIQNLKQTKLLKNKLLILRNTQGLLLFLVSHISKTNINQGVTSSHF